MGREISSLPKRSTEFYWPVPDSAAVCGLPGALSLTLRVAVYVFLALGENATVIVHVALIPKLPPQVLLVIVNRFDPVSETLVIVIGAVPLFKSVNC